MDTNRSAAIGEPAPSAADRCLRLDPDPLALTSVGLVAHVAVDGEAAVDVEVGAGHVACGGGREEDDGVRHLVGSPGKRHLFDAGRSESRGNKLDSRHFILCTDDSHAQTISHEGHMNRAFRHAIVEGLDPMTAIQMCTINTAEHFGLTHEQGLIAPGRWADILLVNDLRDFHAEMVIAREVIAQKGKWTSELPSFPYPRWAANSVHLKRES